MPIFEYVCRSCRSRFDLLVSSSSQPACPDCTSTELDKQLSVFSVGGKSSSSSVREAPGSCGSCGDPRGPGSCSKN
jgi:putative FmdB family regulatory protein